MKPQTVLSGQTWTRKEPYHLPYYAGPKDLPAPLPKVEHILASHDVLNEQAERKVVGLGEHFVVKFGIGVDLLEGETMLFLQQQTKIPIPQIYALFRDHDSGRNFIIMERIFGQSLESEWPSLTQSEKQAIATILRSSFLELRHLESPGGYCSIGHRGLPDGIFWTDEPSNPYAGPFETEVELNDAMVAKYLQSGLPKYKAEFYARAFDNVLRDHKPVLSHGDLQLKNILVRRSRGPGSNNEVKHPLPEIVIIDWEYAGWYPSYWEYARAIFACGRWQDDWSVWVEKIIDPAFNEYAWIHMLLRELWS